MNKRSIGFRLVDALLILMMIQFICRYRISR